MKQNANANLTAVFFKGLILLLMIASQVHASPIKSDETVLFFTVDAYEQNFSKINYTQKPSTNPSKKTTDTSATKSSNSIVWKVPLHAWIFEQEMDSLWRKKLTQQISSEINVQANSPEYFYLQNTLSMFLVDSQSLKTLNLTINQQPLVFGRSGLNGHIEDTIEITADHNLSSLAVEINESVLNKEQKFRADVIRLIPKQGVSIISDIDDTIKNSHVLDKKELIRNTFLRPAQPVKSMNRWYQDMLRQYAGAPNSNTYFHYVSASPWQLYPMLKQFLQQQGFPSGSLYLRNFRFKDHSVLQFLKPSTDYKIETISTLMSRYPGRKFILIGDSGEHDPEIYGHISKQFPEQVAKIYIRKVPGSDVSKQRFEQAFHQVSADKWQLIEEQNLPDFSSWQN